MKPECPSSSLSPPLSLPLLSLSHPSRRLHRKRTFRIFQKPDAADAAAARPLLTAAATVRLSLIQVRDGSAHRSQKQRGHDTSKLVFNALSNKEAGCISLFLLHKRLDLWYLPLLISFAYRPYRLQWQCWKTGKCHSTVFDYFQYKKVLFGTKNLSL